MGLKSYLEPLAQGLLTGKFHKNPELIKKHHL